MRQIYRVLPLVLCSTYMYVTQQFSGFIFKKLTQRTKGIPHCQLRRTKKRHVRVVIIYNILPKSRVKAYWEGGVWMEPDTTSKLLALPHITCFLCSSVLPSILEGYWPNMPSVLSLVFLAHLTPTTSWFTYCFII